jgi:ADP-ribose pyrophosphatase YjhB (NUDIX family)
MFESTKPRVYMSDIASDQRSLPSVPQSQFEPRQAVKGLPSSGNRVLLQKEYHSDGQPFWTLPGGGVENTEKLSTTLRREMHEELRATSIVGDSIGWFPYAHNGMSNMMSIYTVFECAILQPPDPNPAEGVYDVRWIKPDELPPRTLPQVRWLLEERLTG